MEICIEKIRSEFFPFITRIDVSNDAYITEKFVSSNVSSYSLPVYLKLEYFNAKQLLACKYLRNWKVESDKEHEEEGWGVGGGESARLYNYQ